MTHIYRTDIQQMCFVSGEPEEPPADATALIEDIVRRQVTEIMIQASYLANKKKSRTIAPEDLIFLIRHDKPKVNRLKTYLSWKDVRKNAKDQEGDGSELLDDAMSGDAKARNRSNRLRLPWDILQMFGDAVPDGDEDEVEEEENTVTMERLRVADERTKNMSREEYVHWAECRQASFTFKKSKKFREWANLAVITDFRPNDDIIDILGFLTFEMVAKLTEEALKLKEIELTKTGLNPLSRHSNACSLFQRASNEKMPIQARHIEDAHRALQAKRQKCTILRDFSSGLLSTKLNFI